VRPPGTRAISSPNSSVSPHRPCKPLDPPRVVDEWSYRVRGRGRGGEARRSKPARFGAISVTASSDLGGSHRAGALCGRQGAATSSGGDGWRETDGWATLRRCGHRRRELELRMKLPRASRAPAWSCSTEPRAASATSALRRVGLRRCPPPPTAVRSTPASPHSYDSCSRACKSQWN
jgi:hypothetical protein